MATFNSLLLALSFSISICSTLGQPPSCIPTVRNESFAQFVESKNCEVDEKFVNLFTNDEAFNKSILSNVYANVLCIGLMDALTLVPEDMCESFDPFSQISDDDFCSSSKLATLQRISNNSVFDKNSIIFKVSSFTQRYCDVYCKEDNNQLCWAFGIIARAAFKHNSVSTTVPTAAPATQPTVIVPNFKSDDWTTQSQQDVSNDDGSTEYGDNAAEHDEQNNKDEDNNKVEEINKDEENNKDSATIANANEQNDMKEYFNKDNSTTVAEIQDDGESKEHSDNADDENNNKDDATTTNANEQNDVIEYFNNNKQHYDENTDDTTSDDIDQLRDDTSQDYDNYDQDDNQVNNNQVYTPTPQTTELPTSISHSDTAESDYLSYDYDDDDDEDDDDGRDSYQYYQYFVVLLLLILVLVAGEYLATYKVGIMLLSTVHNCKLVGFIKSS